MAKKADSARCIRTRKTWGENEITENLLKSLNKDGRIHVVPAKIKDKYIVRFTVTSFYTTEEDILRDWDVIKSNADHLLPSIVPQSQQRRKLHFQSSLVLANAPQTPKIVNASFLAFVPEFDLTLNELAKELKSRDFMQAYLPLTPRRKPKYLTDASHKNFSFDQVTSQQILLNRGGGSSKLNKIDKMLKIKFLNLTEDSECEQSVQSENRMMGEDVKNSGEFEEKANRVAALKSLSYKLSNQSFNASCEKSMNGKKICPQASLDSKIEYIFQNADGSK